MSGNVENPGDGEIFDILAKMRKLGKYLSEMRTKFEQFGKIIKFEFETMINDIKDTIEEFLKNGKYIILRDAIQQMMSYETLSSCLAHIASNIIHMQSFIITDQKWHKQRISRISEMLEDLTAKVEEYSVETKNLGSMLEEIMRDEDAEKKKKNLKIFDFKIDILAINVKSCMTRVLRVREEIQNGARASQEQYIKTSQRLESYANMGQTAVTIGRLIWSAMAGYSNTVPSGSETAAKGNGISWGKAIGGTVAVAGGITTAGATYGMWKESKNTEEIQSLYEKLEYEARNLEDELIRLQDLIEMCKIKRATE